jgi:hypothetical protein
VLARTRSDIAPLVAEYARLLAVAERLEKDGHDAAALTAWMTAQELNPVSEICGAAVRRLASRVASSGSAPTTAGRDPGALEVPEAPPSGR